MAALTIAQMHRGIRLGVQQVDANFLDGLLPQEIDYYLNEVIIEHVKALYSARTADGRGFEQSQERKDDLRVLFVKDHSIEAVYNGSPLNGYHSDRVVFPENYLFLVSHRSLVQYQRSPVSNPWPTTVGTSRALDPALVTEILVFNRESQSDDIYRLLKDPWNTTYYQEPLVDINEEFINVYTDENFIVKNVIINYIRQPATVENNVEAPGSSIDCDLPGHLHPEIVRKTVLRIVYDLRQAQTQQQ